MNKIATGIAGLAVIALTSLGFSTPSHASTVPSVRSTAVNTYQVKPSTITLALADGKDNLKNLKWSAWTYDYARATGTRVTNDCKPDCASGTDHSTSVTVFLDKVSGSHFTEVSFGKVANATR